MYEYGARNYDPAVGRFFNIDNYAESFLDLTPYQYAGNNSVYFIDKNGEYIYIWDEGKQYKFDGGKLFGQGENGEWTLYTPKAGSFLEQVYTALKQMYEFDTGDGSSGGGSFSKSFLNYFNNETNNVVIFNISSIPRLVQRYLDKAGVKVNETITLSMGSWAYVGLDMKLSNYYYFGSNNKLNRSLLSQIIIHELGHALLRINSIELGTQSWVTEANTKSEVFASYIENKFLNERNIPLRSNYFTPDQGKIFFESSLLLPSFNPINLGNESAIKNLQILNNFKQGLITVPNTNFIFNN